MIAGLPGIMNDMLDRLLFRFILPDAIWKSELGIFTAGARLAVIMMLFIQMFRFAAEPFFFAKASEKDSRKLYSEVMNHFTAFGMFIFLGVMLFIDIIGLFLGKDFRGGISILPVMLMAYLLLGITYNVSMWYKLSGKTNIAIYITSLGLVVTLIVNIGFMPAYSFHASALWHLD
jgi:O-antigen/teichoic acid export membrane protein